MKQLLQLTILFMLILRVNLSGYGQAREEVEAAIAEIAQIELVAFTMDDDSFKGANVYFTMKNNTFHPVYVELNIEHDEQIDAEMTSWSFPLIPQHEKKIIFRFRRNPPLLYEKIQPTLLNYTISGASREGDVQYNGEKVIPLEGSETQMLQKAIPVYREKSIVAIPSYMEFPIRFTTGKKDPSVQSAIFESPFIINWPDGVLKVRKFDREGYFTQMEQKRLKKVLPVKENQVPNKPGINYMIFEGKEAFHSDLSGQEPILQGKLPSLDLTSFQNKVAGNTVVLKGYLSLSNSGIHQLISTTTGALRMMIDDVPVIMTNEKGNHKGFVDLSKGWYPFTFVLEGTEEMETTITVHDPTGSKFQATSEMLRPEK